MRCDKPFYDTQNHSSNLSVSSRMVLYMGHGNFSPKTNFDSLVSTSGKQHPRTKESAKLGSKPISEVSESLVPWTVKSAQIIVDSRKIERRQNAFESWLMDGQSALITRNDHCCPTFDSHPRWILIDRYPHRGNVIVIPIVVILITIEIAIAISVVIVIASRAQKAKGYWQRSSGLEGKR